MCSQVMKSKTRFRFEAPVLRFLLCVTQMGGKGDKEEGGGRQRER